MRVSVVRVRGLHEQASEEVMNIMRRVSSEDEDSSARCTLSASASPSHKDTGGSERRQKLVACAALATMALLNMAGRVKVLQLRIGSGCSAGCKRFDGLGYTCFCTWRCLCAWYGGVIIVMSLLCTVIMRQAVYRSAIGGANYMTSSSAIVHCHMLPRSRPRKCH